MLYKTMVYIFNTHTDEFNHYLTTARCTQLMDALQNNGLHF